MSNYDCWPQNKQVKKAKNDKESRKGKSEINSSKEDGREERGMGGGKCYGGGKMGVTAQCKL